MMDEALSLRNYRKSEPQPLKRDTGVGSDGTAKLVPFPKKAIFEFSAGFSILYRDAPTPAAAVAVSPSGCAMTPSKGVAAR